MQPISYARHQFPPEIIRHAIWLYLRFTLSYRDVEEVLTERGLEISYETVRRWVLKFGPAYASILRWMRPKPTTTWHLDEMVVAIQGRRMYPWRTLSCLDGAHWAEEETMASMGPSSCHRVNRSQYRLHGLFAASSCRNAAPGWGNRKYNQTGWGMIRDGSRWRL